MDEFEATALNRSSEEWEERIARSLRDAARERTVVGARDDHAMTMRELLGSEIHDAILDAVAD